MPLRALSESGDQTFRGGSYDVRGWEVRTRVDDEKVGKVDDVLVDETGIARYLDVDLGLLEKHVLLPIGQASTDAADERVWVPGMTRDQFERIPEWHRDVDRLDTEYETRLGEAYGGVYGSDRYYERPEYTAGWARGRRREPASANVGTTHARLRRLGELHDYEVADHDPDPRGWSVHTSDGRTVGKVNELVVDAAAMKTRYLEVELDASELGLESRERRILVPVGYARLETDDHRVVLDSFAADDLAAMPTQTGEIERGYEDDVRTRFDRRFSGEDRYGHPRYQSDHFYTPRETRR